MMATDKATSNHYLTDEEFNKLDLSKLRPGHPLWGKYLQNPLRGHAEVEKYLRMRNIDPDDFANWVNVHVNGCALSMGSTAELLQLAQVFAHYGHQGIAALATARRARADMH